MTDRDERAETLLMCRCDVDGAKFITSDHDARDHAYIVGATVPVEASNSSLRSQDNALDWKRRASLMTFDEAVKAVASETELACYHKLLAASPHCSISDRRKLAQNALGNKEVFFDWNLPRTADGRFLFAPTMDTLLDRTLAAASLGDVTWARMDLSIPNLKEFHVRFQEQWPEDRLFAAGYTAAYDFAAKGYTPEDITNLDSTMAKMGIVWQVQPAFALQGLNYVTKKFSNLWAEEGMGGFFREIQQPAMKADTDGYEKMEWSGGYLADAYGDILGDL